MAKMNEKLRQPEILKEIGGCVFSGMKWSGLQKHLKENFNIEASKESIKHVYNKYLQRRNEIVESEEEIQKDIRGEVENTVINTKETLQEVHDFVKKIKEKAYNNDDWKTALDASKEILNQLTFQEKVLNRMQEGINVENLNKIEITQIVVNKIDELEKQGRIKILDPSLRQQESATYSKHTDDDSVVDAEFREDE